MGPIAQFTVQYLPIRAGFNVARLRNFQWSIASFTISVVIGRNRSRSGSDSIADARAITPVAPVGEGTVDMFIFACLEVACFIFLHGTSNHVSAEITSVRQASITRGVPFAARRTAQTVFAPLLPLCVLALRVARQRIACDRLRLRHRGT